MEGLHALSVVLGLHLLPFGDLLPLTKLQDALHELGATADRL